MCIFLSIWWNEKEKTVLRISKWPSFFGCFSMFLAKFSQKHYYFYYRMVSYTVFNGPKQIRTVNYHQWRLIRPAFGQFQNMHIFQRVPILKMPPRPHPPALCRQTTSFAHLIWCSFRKYMSPKIPRGGQGFHYWIAV